MYHLNTWQVYSVWQNCNSIARSLFIVCLTISKHQQKLYLYELYTYNLYKYNFCWCLVYIHACTYTCTIWNIWTLRYVYFVQQNNHTGYAAPLVGYERLSLKPQFTFLWHFKPLTCLSWRGKLCKLRSGESTWSTARSFNPLAAPKFQAILPCIPR